MSSFHSFLDEQGIHADIYDGSLDIAVILYDFLKHNKQPKQQHLGSVLNFCCQQSLKNELLKQILDKPYIYTAEELDVFLKIVLPHITDDLRDLFVSWFVNRQYAKNVRELDHVYCVKRFRLVDTYLAGKYEWFDGMLQRIRERKTHAGIGKYAFLFYALTLNSGQFTDEANVNNFPKMSPDLLQNMDFYYASLR